MSCRGVVGEQVIVNAQRSADLTQQETNNEVPKGSLAVFGITVAITTVLATGYFANLPPNRYPWWFTALYLVTLSVAAVGTALGWLVVRKIVLSRVGSVFKGQVLALGLLIPLVTILAFYTLKNAGPEPLYPWELDPTAKASATAENQQDTHGETFSYEADNAIDGEDDTAWRVEGNGKDHWIELTYNRPVRVSEIDVIPGHDKTDGMYDRFHQLYVVHKALIKFSGTDGKYDRKDNRTLASFAYDRSSQPVKLRKPIDTRKVRIVIKDTYPPCPEPGPPDCPEVAQYPPVYTTAISEIEVK